MLLFWLHDPYDHAALGSSPRQICDVEAKRLENDASNTTGRPAGAAGDIRRSGSGCRVFKNESAEGPYGSFWFSSRARVGRRKKATMAVQAYRTGQAHAGRVK
jgi:hypothetical protein